MAPAFPLGVEVPEPGGRLRDHPVCSVWRQSPRCRSRTRSCRAVSLNQGRLAAHSVGRQPSARSSACDPNENLNLRGHAGSWLRASREPPDPVPGTTDSPLGSNLSCSGYLDQRLGRLSDALPLCELQGSWRSAVPWITLRTRTSFDAMDLWTMGTDSREPPVHVRLP